MENYCPPHNQIRLQLPDGRDVSIVQNGPQREGHAYGHADQHMCEVWVKGEPDVKGHLDLSELIEYLTELSNGWTLSEGNYDED
tara:strand:- start:148 stop:399 length:252 start_codon:yes stop_codon:yes gene_type:complete